MDNLRVPYGLSEAGELICADLALKDSIYCCPCCGERLTLRAGKVRANHFAHPSGSNCSLESILHITAKKLIQAAIQRNAVGNEEIGLETPCHNCGGIFTTRLPAKTFSNADLEVKVGDFVCDVVGYRDDSIGLAIEIFNTHAVDEIKAEKLQAYWVELRAEDVINSPTEWTPTQMFIKPTYCGDCKNHMNRVLSVADKFGVDRSLYSAVKDPARATYIADIETCFKCKQEIPVYWWQGVPFCEVEPPNPKPNSIKFRFSKKFGGSYWANTCANCNMIQGDNFLFLFENAPFKNLPISTDVQSGEYGVKVESFDTPNAAVSAFMRTISRY